MSHLPYIHNSAVPPMACGRGSIISQPTYAYGSVECPIVSQNNTHYNQHSENHSEQCLFWIKLIEFCFSQKCYLNVDFLWFLSVSSDFSCHPDQNQFTMPTNSHFQNHYVSQPNHTLVASLQQASIQSQQIPTIVKGILINSIDLHRKSVT